MPKRKNCSGKSIFLNKVIVGTEGHHIDNTHVIYISTELHQSIRHNLYHGKNMGIINNFALLYLEAEELSSLGLVKEKKHG